MAYKPIREFSANVGDYSTGTGGPDAIENDIDSINRMFDPETEHEGGVPGGIAEGNIQAGAATDAIIGDRTIDQATADGYTNTGSLTKLLSLIAKTIKALKGTANWYANTSDTIEGLHAKTSANTENIAVNTNSIASHKSSGDHDSRYYTKSQINQYLGGGETIIRREVFTILSVDNGDGTFTYSDANGVQHDGALGNNGEQIFTLQKGSYQVDSERIEATINDTLHRSTTSGGLIEVDTTHVGLTSPEGVGAEVTFKYYESVGISVAGFVQYGSVQPTVDAIWFKVVG